MAVFGCWSAWLCICYCVGVRSIKRKEATTTTTWWLCLLLSVQQKTTHTTHACKFYREDWCESIVLFKLLTCHLLLREMLFTKCYWTFIPWRVMCVAYILQQCKDDFFVFILIRHFLHPFSEVTIRINRTEGFLSTAICRCCVRVSRCDLCVGSCQPVVWFKLLWDDRRGWGVGGVQRKEAGPSCLALSNDLCIMKDGDNISHSLQGSTLWQDLHIHIVFPSTSPPPFFFHHNLFCSREQDICLPDTALEE